MDSLIVLGGTGSGKSTLINALANFLWDVDYNDSYRFKIIKDDKSND